jgi:hypothetical protein
VTGAKYKTTGVTMKRSFIFTEFIKPLMNSYIRAVTKGLSEDLDGDGTPDSVENFVHWMTRYTKATANPWDDMVAGIIRAWLLSDKRNYKRIERMLTRKIKAQVEKLARVSDVS